MAGKQITFNMFSEGRIELTKEIKEHPDLVFDVAEVKAAGDGSWEDTVACVAAHCYIVVDGHYSLQDLEKLYEILIFELRKKRMVNAGDSTPKIIIPT